MFWRLFRFHEPGCIGLHKKRRCATTTFTLLRYLALFVFLVPSSLAQENLQVETGGYEFLETIIFTIPGSGTYFPDSRADLLIMECIGGGGGGGSAFVNAAGIGNAAGGGGSGSYAKLKIETLQSSYGYTVGAGGLGGAAQNPPLNGGDGGSSTIAGMTCPGGRGGGASATGAGADSKVNAGGGSAAPTGMDFGVRGGFGRPGMWADTGVTCILIGGAGADSYWGDGAQGTEQTATCATNVAAAGSDGVAGSGSGGSGGAVLSAIGLGQQAVGGRGGSGNIHIHEYALASTVSERIDLLAFSALPGFTESESTLVVLGIAFLTLALYRGWWMVATAVTMGIPFAIYGSTYPFAPVAMVILILIGLWLQALTNGWRAIRKEP